MNIEQLRKEKVLIMIFTLIGAIGSGMLATNDISLYSGLLIVILLFASGIGVGITSYIYVFRKEKP